MDFELECEMCVCVCRPVAVNYLGRIQCMWHSNGTDILLVGEQITVDRPICYSNPCAAPISSALWRFHICGRASEHMLHIFVPRSPPYKVQRVQHRPVFELIAYTAIISVCLCVYVFTIDGENRSVGTSYLQHVIVGRTRVSVIIITISFNVSDYKLWPVIIIQFRNGTANSLYVLMLALGVHLWHRSVCERAFSAVD